MKMDNSEDWWTEYPLFAPEGTVVPRLPSQDAAQNVPEVLGALSHLLHDEESPEEIAEELRDQGNKFFRRGGREYFKLAIARYTEALSVASQSHEIALTATVLSNRAAAHVKLKNYGKALKDAEAAVQLMPDHVKSRYRAVEAASALGKHNKVICHADAAFKLLSTQGRESSADASYFLTQRKLGQVGLEKEEEVARRKQVVADGARAALRKMNNALAARAVTMGLPLFSLQRKYSITQPAFDAGDDTSLVWPILLVYPDAGTGSPSGECDYLERVCEDATMEDLITTVFPLDAPPAPWDTNGLYFHSVPRLEARYRVGWTKAVEEADGEEKVEFVGSSLGEHEMGDWKTIPRTTTVAQLLRRKDYVVPLFPVVYIGLPGHSSFL